MANRMHGDNSVIIIHQSGRGTPTHISPKATMFFDIDAAIAYINKNGLSQWSQLVDMTMISGATFGSDTYVTGGTYSNGTARFTNNTGGTFTVTGFYTGSTDVFVTGGTYNNLTGVATFVNNTGGTFNIFGFNLSTGTTSQMIVSYTYNPLNNTFTIIDSSGNTFNAGFTTVSGLTVTNGLSATTISATTFYGDGSNLTGLRDVFVTGGTYSNGLTTFRNNTGGTFTINGYYTGTTDVFVTGGTYSNGTTTFRNNTGGTFNISGFYTGATDVYVTGGTYSSGTILFRNNTGGTFNVLGFTALTATTLYTGDGSLLNNRIVNTSGYSLSFSSATNTNQFIISGSSIGLGVIPTTAYTLTIKSPTDLGADGLRIASNNQSANLHLGFANIINTVGDLTLQSTADLRLQGGASGTRAVYLRAGAGDYTSIFSSGNATIGGFTDAGFRLDVQGTGRFTNGITVNSAQANSNTLIGSTGTPFSLTVNGQTGNVGVNVNNPVARFQVNGGSWTPIYTLVDTGYPYLQAASTATSGKVNTLLVSSGGNLKTHGIIGSGDYYFVNNVSFNTGIGQDTHILYYNGNMYAQGNTMLGTQVDNGYRLNVNGLTYISASANPLTLLGLTTGNSSSILTVGPTGVVYSASLSTITGSSTTTYIQNQSASAQTASFWITGTGETNSYFAGRTSGPNGNFKTGGLIAYPTGTTKSSYIQLGYDSLLNAGWITALSEGSAYRDIILGTGNIKVGINTTSAPAARLEILNSPNFPSIQLTKNAGQYWTIGNRTEGSGTSFNIAYNTTDILSLTTGGNALLGTTTDNGNRLNVNGSAYISATGNPLTLLGLFSGTDTTFLTIGSNGVVHSASTSFLTGNSVNTYTTAATLSNSTIYFNRNDVLSAYSVTLTGLTSLTDVFVTGGTYSNGTTTFRNNTGGTFTVNGYYTGTTDVFVTGGTYSSGTILFRNNTGGTFTVTNLFSGTTDVYVTGGTYSNGTAIFTNNTGGTFSLSGFSTGITSSYITGFTYSNNEFTIRNNTGGTLSALFNIVTGLTITGLLSGNTAVFSGTGNILTVKGKNNDILNVSDAVSGTVFSVGTTGGTTHFSVTTGGTRIHTALFDSTNSTGTTGQILSTTPSGPVWINAASGGGGGAAITAFTYANNTFNITESSGSTFSALFNVVTGLTVTGLLSGNTAIFSGTGNILSVRGISGDVFTVNDVVSNTLFSVGPTSANTNFSVTTGGTRIHTALFDSTNSTGTTGQVLSTTPSGPVWINVSGSSSGVDVYVTGGTYNNGTGTATFTNNTGGTFTVSGFITSGSSGTDVFVTGGTYSNGTTTFRNNTGGTFTVNGYYTGATDVFITGGTYSNGTATLRNNTGGTFNITGFTTGTTDVFVTGGTYSNGVILFRNNTGGTFTVTNLFSGTTDVYVTGGTYSNGITTFRNNTGGTFTVNGYYTGATDVFVTGGTYNSGVILFRNNTGGTFTVTNLFSGTTDVYVTGGTYNNILGTATFTNNTGGTFSVVGFNVSTGNTSTAIVSYTYNPLNNTFTITDSTGNTFNAQIRVVSGLTVTNGLSATTISATTFYGDGSNLTGLRDVFVTGGTYNSGTILFRNNTGGTFTVTNLFSGTTDVYVTGGTYSSGTILFRNNTGGTFTVTNLFSGTTDVFVTGGTYSNGTTTFINNTGGTFNISGYYTGATDVYVTGGTYSNGTATLRNNTGGTFNITGFYTGATDVFVTGGTYSNGVILFRNNTGGTFTVTNLFSGTTDVFVTGGTYNSGVILFRNNTGGTFTVTNLFSGTTDVYVTGGTYSNGVILFRNNTGGTFTVTNLFSGTTDVYVTGGTYSNGVILFRNNTGGTFTVTNLFSGTTDVYVTGGTYNSGTGIATLTNNTGGTFNITGFTSASATTLYSGNGSLSGNRVVNIGTNTLNFSSSTYNNHLVLSGGNTGFGVLVPTQKVDVSGSIKFSGALMPNNDSGTNGALLTSSGPNTPPYWSIFTGSTFSPTISASTNITGVTGFTTNYEWIGDWIHVWGEYELKATAAGDFTSFSMELPITSGVLHTYDIAGTAVGTSTRFSDDMRIFGNIDIGKAMFVGIPTSTSSLRFSFHFSCRYYAP